MGLLGHWAYNFKSNCQLFFLSGRTISHSPQHGRSIPAVCVLTNIDAVTIFKMLAIIADMQYLVLIFLIYKIMGKIQECLPPRILGETTEMTNWEHLLELNTWGQLQVPLLPELAM